QRGQPRRHVPKKLGEVGMAEVALIDLASADCGDCRREHVERFRHSQKQPLVSAEEVFAGVRAGPDQAGAHQAVERQFVEVDDELRVAGGEGCGAAHAWISRLCFDGRTRFLRLHRNFAVRAVYGVPHVLELNSYDLMAIAAFEIGCEVLVADRCGALRAGRLPRLFEVDSVSISADSTNKARDNADAAARRYRAFGFPLWSIGAAGFRSLAKSVGLLWRDC